MKAGNDRIPFQLMRQIWVTDDRGLQQEMCAELEQSSGKKPFKKTSFPRNRVDVRKGLTGHDTLTGTAHLATWGEHREWYQKYWCRNVWTQYQQQRTPHWHVTGRERKTLPAYDVMFQCFTLNNVNVLNILLLFLHNTESLALALIRVSLDKEGWRETNLRLLEDKCITVTLVKEWLQDN